ncbi:hypothetical protein [Streptomyces sp. NPDC048338]|uniref:hypothetical protein n=1 Tax=Streptomyces sp. NPDC048338 TaxID=3365536 RepID=UPI0037136F20
MLTAPRRHWDRHAPDADSETTTDSSGVVMVLQVAASCAASAMSPIPSCTLMSMRS